MKRALQMLALVICGEMVFALPFHINRFFRATYLESLEISNTQLGDAFAVYGVTAMISYVLGGFIADRFPPRYLMAFALVLTGAGGLYLATLPGAPGLTALFGYWGVTSILLSWAAMVTATRVWGGHLSQGQAFGLLEGGRGLIASGFALLGVFVLGLFIESQLKDVDPEQRIAGMQALVYYYVAITWVAAIVAWILIPGDRDDRSEVERSGRPDREPTRRLQWDGTRVKAVVARPATWAMAGIIVCAYCGYKGLDNYSLYAVQVMDMTEVEGARYFALMSYARPVAAVLAGLIADRFSPSRTLRLCFAALFFSWLLLAWAGDNTSLNWVVHANLLFTMFAVFAMRGVYFAMVEETGTPRRVTGTTVGLVSFVGFTPEIFFAPIGGRILDANPGATGFQHYFLFLATIALIGAVIAWYAARRQKHWRENFTGMPARDHGQPPEDKR